LHREGYFADLVEKQRASIGELEAAGLVFECAGERALHVAEEFALEETFGHRAAVQFDHRTVASRTSLVDGSRDQLLSGAAFSGDEHGRVGRRDQLNLVELYVDGGVAQV
jgi:hypothetical protein